MADYELSPEAKRVRDGTWKDRLGGYSETTRLCAEELKRLFFELGNKTREQLMRLF